MNHHCLVWQNLLMLSLGMTQESQAKLMIHSGLHTCFYDPYAFGVYIYIKSRPGAAVWVGVFKWGSKAWGPTKTTPTYPHKSVHPLVFLHVGPAHLLWGFFGGLVLWVFLGSQTRCERRVAALLG